MWLSIAHANENWSHGEHATSPIASFHSKG